MHCKDQQWNRERDTRMSTLSLRWWCERDDEQWWRQTSKRECHRQWTCNQHIRGQSWLNLLYKLEDYLELNRLKMHFFEQTKVSVNPCIQGEENKKREGLCPGWLWFHNMFHSFEPRLNLGVSHQILKCFAALDRRENSIDIQISQIRFRST